MTKFVRRILFLLNLLLILYTLLVYQLSYAADIQHWLGGFMMLSMPLVIIANIIFVLIWLFFKSKRVFLSLGVLLLGFPFLKRTFTFHSSPTANNSASHPQNLTILSYNLMWSDAANYYEKHDSTNTSLLVQTASELEADVKCFQELYNQDNIWAFRLIKKLKEKNPYYTYIHATPGNDKGQGEIGLAIFSKYPILQKKEIYWKPNHNGLLAVDVLVNKDTIRIVNVQLKSMGIRVEKVIDNRNNEAVAKREARNIFNQLREGFIRRAEQIKILESWIEESPYPLIVAGDFNELPYGYAYGRTRKYLQNAFEDAGNGFGFTYNRLPNFIRIDNQFYDKHLIVKQFRTISTVDYSDHYPIFGEYSLKR